MKPEDFDDALKDRPSPKIQKSLAPEWYVKHYDTISAALRIAKAVCGEPSKSACYAGTTRPADDVDNVMYGMYVGIFKAMRDQMIKEAVG